MPQSKTSSFGTSQRINHDSDRFYSSRLYTGLPADSNILAKEDSVLPCEFENTIFAHSSEYMHEVPDNSIHLMATSPPYNVAKQYDTNLSLEEYLQMLKNVFQETYRVLVHGGRACINIANLGRKPYIPLTDYVSRMMCDIGYLMRGEIIWQKGAGAGVSMAWGSWKSASNPVLRDTHEYILVFSKGAFTRKPSSGSGSGSTNSTIEKEQFMEWTKSVWTMNTVSAKKIGHPAPFPIELPFRLIQLYSYKNDIVLDPFMGSGTSAIAALQSGRKYIGYDNNPQYVALAESRIAKTANQDIHTGNSNRKPNKY